MDEAGRLAQVSSDENVEFGWLGDPIRHLSMLPDERFEPATASTALSPALSHFGDKLLFALSHEPDEFVVAGVFVRSCPQHHLGQHR